MTSVPIDFCCNDPDNGLFAGRVEGIQIHYQVGCDPFAELEARRNPAPVLRIEDDGIRLSGKRWPIDSSADWVGNWCWNRYWFAQDVAVDFLIWLHGRGQFTLSCGEERLFCAWRRAEAIGSFRPFLAAQCAEIAR